MTTRLLPPEEWARLAPTQLPALLPFAVPDDTQIVVVEQDERVIGCVAVLRVVHVEGVWIAPEHRGKAAVMRRLVRGMYTAARRWAPTWALAGSADATMHTLLSTHLGAVRVPMETYVVPLEKESPCLQP